MPHPATRLNKLLTEAGSTPLDIYASAQFEAYLALLQKWNARTNLTAIRDTESILSRHFLESILCARALPHGIQTLLDFGSGAGFPGLPIALLRPEIHVTLAESQNKKAAFLNEVIRTLAELDPSPADPSPINQSADRTTSHPSLRQRVKIHPGRAETLKPTWDCITLRAVDNLSAALPAAIGLLAPHGVVAILTTQAELSTLKAHPLTWISEQPLPPNTNRRLLFGNLTNRSTP